MLIELYNQAPSYSCRFTCYSFIGKRDTHELSNIQQSVWKMYVMTSPPLLRHRGLPFGAPDFAGPKDYQPFRIRSPYIFQPASLLPGVCVLPMILKMNLSIATRVLDIL